MHSPFNCTDENMQYKFDRKNRKLHTVVALAYIVLLKHSNQVLSKFN